MASANYPKLMKFNVTGTEKTKYENPTIRTIQVEAIHPIIALELAKSALKGYSITMKDVVHVPKTSTTVEIKTEETPEQLTDMLVEVATQIVEGE